MKQKIINDKRFFVWETDQGCKLDMTAVHMQVENGIEGLLAFRMIHDQESVYFRYSADNGITLMEWLRQIHRRSEVLEMIKSLILVCEEMEHYLMKSEFLYLKPEFILMSGNRCRTAYLPLQNASLPGVPEFLRGILGRIRYAMDEDYIYIFELHNAVSRGDIRTCTDLKKWVRVLETGTASGVGTAALVREPADDEKDGYQGGLKDDPGDDDNTSVVYAASRAFFKRPGSDENYELKQDTSVIGAGLQADIRLRNNPAISRKHIKICKEGNLYFVEDLQSSNGSYINGEPMKPMKKYPLGTKVRIRLADEDFIFEIRK